jgi:6-phosphogluconolactonase (cycloisomerase 2 family)
VQLELVEVQHSRGEKPVSITVNRGIAYVLNSGEFQNGLPTPPNCTTGRLPSVSGFRVSSTGQLTPIPHSRRLLSGDPFSGCAQVSFDPSGKVLVATERLAVTPGETPDDEGRINTWRVRANGTLGRHRIIDATGQGPFGFTFSKSGALLTTEQFDGPDGPHRGAAAGYRLNRNGTLTRTSRSVHNGGTDTCWFVVTDDGRYGFTSSFFGTGRISSYRTETNGSLRLLQTRAADARVHQGASDLSLSGDSRYLYSLNSFEGTISVFRVRNGDLTLVQVVHAHRPSMTGAPIGLAAS